MTARPMSRSRPYCTPEGQALSHARQVRQRSRCSCVLEVTGAPSRTVELIAEQLVSGTGGKTEAAVYARAQDRMRLAPGGGVFDEVRERGAHGFPDPIGTQQRGAVTARVPAKDSKLIRAAAVRNGRPTERQRSGPVLAWIAGRRGRPPLARVAGGVASRVIPLRERLVHVEPRGIHDVRDVLALRERGAFVAVHREVL